MSRVEDLGDLLLCPIDVYLFFVLITWYVCLSCLPFFDRIHHIYYLFLTLKLSVTLFGGLRRRHFSDLSIRGMFLFLLYRIRRSLCVETPWVTPKGPVFLLVLL